MKPTAVTAFLIAVCLVGRPVFAQSADEAPENARVRLGALRVRPTVALTNLGVDNNVFNESDLSRPKSDFTTTVTPAADLWMRIGRSTLSGSVREDLVYYQTYASERSVNQKYAVGLAVPTTKLVFRVGASYLDTRDRPGYEIDVRSRHTEGTYQGSVEMRAFSKTFVTANASQTRVEFERDATYLGAALDEALNRTVSSAGLGARYQVTPVTALVFDVRRDQDRFEFSPLRDSDSTKVSGGVRFTTLITGSAVFGYRMFRPLTPDVPEYNGGTMSVNLQVSPLGSTHIGIDAKRDLEYSYDIRQPYYIGTGVLVSLTQSVFGPFDAMVRVGVQDLAYRGRLGLGLSLKDRNDTINAFGGGIGYRVSGGMRVGFNVDNQQRTSELIGHSYGGLRYGTSVTYGF